MQFEKVDSGLSIASCRRLHPVRAFLHRLGLIDKSIDSANNGPKVRAHLIPPLLCQGGQLSTTLVSNFASKLQSTLFRGNIISPDLSIRLKHHLLIFCKRRGTLPCRTTTSIEYTSTEVEKWTRIESKARSTIRRGVKRQVGEWTGDTKTQAEGAAQQVKGKAEKAWGNVKDAARDVNARANEQSANNQQNTNREREAAHRK
jgi:uncharacterized protein YjbJ (UPF0337 family)